MFSSSASWSVLLVSPLVLTSCRSALLPAVSFARCRSALLLSSHCPSSSACLCFTAGSLRLFVTFYITHVACSSSSSRASVLDKLLTRPRADPHVLLVVRWLRHQPSLSLSPPPRAAGFVTSLSKLRAAVLMAGGWMRSCGSCNFLLCLSSRSPCSQGAHLSRCLQSSLLWLAPGGQSGTLDSVTHVLIDQFACLVEPSLLLRASCCPAASTSGATVACESTSRGFVVGLVCAAFFKLLLSLLSLHRTFTSCSRGIRRLDTICGSSHTFDTGFLLLDVVLQTRFCHPRVACLRHQMLLICWYVFLVMDLDFVLSMGNSAVNSSP